MKMKISFIDYTPDVEANHDQLSEYIDDSFIVKFFYVARHEDGTFYYVLTFFCNRKEISVFSCSFALVRDLAEDISKFADFFYSKFQIELPFPETLKDNNETQH